MTIKEAIRTMVKDMVKTQVIIGKVIAVDEANMCCDIDMQTGPEIYDVRIRAVIDGEAQGIMVVPEVGSYVLVGLINNRLESAFVCGYSKVDRVQVVASNTIDLESSEITLRNADFGGLVIGEKITEALNYVINDVNDFKKIIQNWTPVITTLSDGGGSLQEAASTWVAQSLDSVDTVNLVNPNIKHG